MTRDERLYRQLLRVYPASFRANYGDLMTQLFADQLRAARESASKGATARLWLRSLGDLIMTSPVERISGRRAVALSLGDPGSSLPLRALGAAGVGAGAVLLVAFFVTMAEAWFPYRLVLFNSAVIAVLVGLHVRQRPASPRLARLGVIPPLLANGWYLAMVMLDIAGVYPFAENTGFVFFLAGLAMWLSATLFGLIALAIGVLSRWGPLALAIGSPLALSGMDRLGLTGAGNETVFTTLSLVGIFVHGVGWILLGLDLATRRSAATHRPTSLG